MLDSEEAKDFWLTSSYREVRKTQWGLEKSGFDCTYFLQNRFFPPRPYLFIQVEKIINSDHFLKKSCGCENLKR